MEPAENIKIVGEIKHLKVFIAPCTWATKLKIHKCTNWPPCENYVYGTMRHDMDPLVIGWCHELELILARAQGHTRMLERAGKTNFEAPTFKRSNEPDPGYR